MFYPARRDAITDAVKLLHLALKLVIQSVIGGLLRCHNYQCHILKLALLTGVVVDKCCAIWTEARQKIVRGQPHPLRKYATIP